MTGGTPAAQPAGPDRPLTRWLRRRSIARFEMGCVAAFHIFVGLTVALAPRNEIVTPGTAALFGTIHLPLQVIFFLATGAAAAAAAERLSYMRLCLTWCGVFPVGGAWIYGITCAVLSGHGNAVFPVVWSFLLIWWMTLAVRCYLGGTEDRWGGG